MRSDKLGETLLPKRIALPIFASDPLSSVAYAPQEIFLVLSVAGVAYFHQSFWFAVAVARADGHRRRLLPADSCTPTPAAAGTTRSPSMNLGQTGGLTVASALLVDYVLTVAVSVAAGVDNLASAVAFVGRAQGRGRAGIIVLLTLVNLRGSRRPGVAFAIPTYAFIVGVMGMLAIGSGPPLVLDDDLRAPTAGYEIVAEHGNLAGFALVFLMLRAFASGCAALTGVEAIANGVPAFRKPKSKNAATTLLLMGALAVTMFAGLVGSGPAHRHSGRRAPRDRHPHQRGAGRAGLPAGPDHRPGRGCGLRRRVGDVRLPRHGHRDDPVLRRQHRVQRLPCAGLDPRPATGSCPGSCAPAATGWRSATASSLLAIAAGGLVYAFDAEVTRLIQLYIIGVFVSFTLGQTGMVRHWTAAARDRERPGRAQAGSIRSRDINSVGLSFTGAVLVIVLITKFTHGAYLVLIAMPILFLMMQAIRRHYDAAGRRADPAAGRRDAAQPDPRRRPDLPAAHAGPAGARLRPRHPARHAHRADRPDLGTRRRSICCGSGPSATSRSR